MEDSDEISVGANDLFFQAFTVCFQCYVESFAVFSDSLDELFYDRAVF